MNEFARREDESKYAHKKRVRRMLTLADVMRRERITPDDPEFAEKVSPYLAGEIDPSVARHDVLPLDEGVELTLKGYQVPEDHEGDVVPGKIDGVEFEVHREPGTVAAIHTENTPAMYGHEYRHKNYPDLSERRNRIMDMVAAQSDYDVDSALRLYADQLRLDAPSSAIPEARKRFKFIDQFGGPEAKIIAKETGRDREDVLEESKTMQFLNEAKDLDRYNEGLAERNAKRRAGEPETVADSLRAVLEKLGLM